MSNTSDFVDALQVAGDSMSSLALAAAAARMVVIDAGDANQVEQAITFATKSGPAGLELARTRGDPQKLVDLQRATDNITNNLEDFLVTDAVLRFLAFPVTGLLALAPAEILDKQKDALLEVAKHLPPPPQDLPWYVFAGGGAAAGGVMALTMTGNPKAILGGVVGGSLLGLGAQWALAQLSKKFSI